MSRKAISGILILLLRSPVVLLLVLVVLVGLLLVKVRPYLLGGVILVVVDMRDVLRNDVLRLLVPVLVGDIDSIVSQELLSEAHLFSHSSLFLGRLDYTNHTNYAETAAEANKKPAKVRTTSGGALEESEYKGSLGIL